MVIGRQASGPICLVLGREPISGAKKHDPKQNTSERSFCSGFLNKRTRKVTVMGHLSLFMLDTWIQLLVKYPITTGVILLEFYCLQKKSFGNWVIFAPSAWSYSNKTLEKAKTKSGYVLRFSLARISKEGNSTESEVTYTDYTPLKLWVKATEKSRCEKILSLRKNPAYFHGVC